MQSIGILFTVLSLAGVLRFFEGNVSGPPRNFERYKAVFEEQTERCGVGFYVRQMLAAQIEQESLWNPQAISYANAKGLSQITSSGLAEIGRLYPELRGGDPFDPKFAILAQCLYMKHFVVLWTRQLDDPIEILRLAFASYNAGRSSILREWYSCKNDLNCDENQWFGNVADKCTRRLQSNCDQSKHYVTGIESRVPKYYNLRW